MAKKSTIIEFINKAKNAHDDFYDYSLVEYINNNTKIKIICPIHGIFEQLPRTHTSGNKCSSCVFDSYKTSYDNFIIKFNQIFNERYDYSKNKYVNMFTKITIICPIHGEFEQTPCNHLKGYGCQKCNKENDIKIKNDLFITKAKEKHKGLYSYELVKYIGKDYKVDIICKKHHIFKQSPHNHMKGKGCPVCKESSGEKEIRNLLKKNNIKYVPQYKFPDCKNINPLPFDFYLPDYNICIEFNGKQHYEPVSHFGGVEALKETQKRDKIKIGYCRNNNIPLIIIKYNENILDVLNKYLTS